MTETTWPPELLQTPDGWGETVITTPASMADIVDSMKRELGADYASISVRECCSLDFVKVLDASTALYAGEWHHDGYRRNMRRYGVAIRRDGNGADDFRRIAFWDTPEYCDYTPEEESAATP